MIFFDIDGTLVDHRYAAEAAVGLLWQRNSVTLACGRDEFAKVWDQVIDGRMRATLDWCFLREGPVGLCEVFLQFGCRMCAKDAAREFSQYRADYAENWRLFDDVLDCFGELDGLPLGVISNGDRQMQTDKLRRFSLLDRFQTVVISEDMRLTKPAPGIFHRACFLADKKPGECIYVGDSLEDDMVGSQRAGLASVWLNRNEYALDENFAVQGTLRSGRSQQSGASDESQCSGDYRELGENIVIINSLTLLSGAIESVVKPPLIDIVLDTKMGTLHEEKCPTNSPKRL